MSINKAIFDKYSIDINHLIPEIIDTIVEVYGEKHRSTIEERLRSIKVFSYVRYKDVDYEYLSELNHIREMLGIKFLRELGIEVSQEIEDEVYKDGSYYFTEEQKKTLKKFFENNYFYKENFVPIFNFDEQALKDAKKWEYQNIIYTRCKLLKQYGLDISEKNYKEVIASPKGKQVMEEVKRAYKIARKLAGEYDRLVEDYAEEVEYVQECERINNELNLKYLKQFYVGILAHVSEEERKMIKKALEQSEKKNMTGWTFLDIADPNHIYKEPFLEGKDYLLAAFQEKYDSIVYNEDYTAERIRNNRIKYFKAKGIDLGEDYASYEQNEKCNKIRPNKNLVAIIVELSNKAINEKDQEFFVSTSNYQDIKNKLLELNLQLTDGASIDAFQQSCTCVCPNIVKDENGEYKSINPIYVPLLNLNKGYRDVLIMHEILHVVELSIHQITEKEVIIKTGFDFLKEEWANGEMTPDNEKYEHNIREFEILSENLHQRMAMLVTEKLHQKGIYLFDDPKNSKIKGMTSYEQVNVMTEMFFVEFYQQIVDSLVEENMNQIYITVGKENLKMLNELVMEYRNLPYYEMMSNVIDKKDTELVRKRYELINKSAELVKQMKLYKEQNVPKYQISTQVIGKSTIGQENQKLTAAAKAIYQDMQEEIRRE